ncbi:MAG: DUF3990 domain-containing protein [Bacteroidales bacterium]|nr:DUF3990 domain-containing protein [Bacteroidales bacterium]
MRLFHGGLEIIEHPEIRQPSRTLDYGSGFYTTTSFEQAEDWVRRRMREFKTDKGFVNVYELDKTSLNGYKTLFFNEPTEEWVDFVMKNRTQFGFTHDYDIVCGPVANDRVYAAFALFEGGVLNKQELIHELKSYRLIDQYLFHSEAALKLLTFVEGKEVVL